MAQYEAAFDWCVQTPSTPRACANAAPIRPYPAGDVILTGDFDNVRHIMFDVEFSDKRALHIVSSVDKIDTPHAEW